MELNTTQIAALCQVTERTVQRWIANGKLHVEPALHGRYRVTEADIEAAMPPDVVRLVERIETLETDVRGLQRQIDELKQEKHAPPARILRPAPAPYTVAPGGQVSARSFAAAHEITRERMEGMIKSGALETTLVPFRNAMQHQLTPEQQHTCIVSWQASGTSYTPCEHCPHASEQR